VAYAVSDKIKIIDLEWPSRSVTTSMVGPTLATAGLFVRSAVDRCNKYQRKLKRKQAHVRAVVRRFLPFFHACSVAIYIRGAGVGICSWSPWVKGADYTVEGGVLSITMNAALIFNLSHVAILMILIYRFSRSNLICVWRHFVAR